MIVNNNTSNAVSSEVFFENISIAQATEPCNTMACTDTGTCYTWLFGRECVESCILNGQREFNCVYVDVADCQWTGCLPDFNQ